MGLKRSKGSMKINAKLTILVSKEGATIEVIDDDSAITFLDMHLSAEQFMAALGRQACVDVETTELHGLDKVGKVHECKDFVFEMPADATWETRKAVATKIAMQLCPNGWESDGYFSSQGSFFKKDGKDYAKTTIRRWVTKGGE